MRTAALPARKTAECRVCNVRLLLLLLHFTPDQAGPVSAVIEVVLLLSRSLLPFFDSALSGAFSWPSALRQPSVPALTELLRGVVPASGPPRSPSPRRLDFLGASFPSPMASPALGPPVASLPASGKSPASSSDHSFLVIPPGPGPSAPDPFPMDLPGLASIRVPPLPCAATSLDLRRVLGPPSAPARASAPRPLLCSPLAAPPLPLRVSAPVFPLGPPLLSAPAPTLLPRRGFAQTLIRPATAAKVNAFGDAVRSAPFVHCGFFPVSSSDTEVSSMASEAGRALTHFRGMFCDFVAELGESSTLFLHTKSVPNPRELRTRAIAKNAPSTLQLYLRSWSAWVSHAARFGFDPADPPPGSVPQWLQLTSAPSGLSTSSFKALSWMARVAGLPSLHSQLQTPLCTAFLSATGPVEKREALPFSVSFVAWLERRIIDPACPVPDCIVIGSVLCLTWASLRWNDGLWSPPSRVVLQANSLSGLATRTKSCRASMSWGCQLLGLTCTSASCWGISWVNALQQCVADTSRLFPARVVDFLLPVLSPDSTHPVFVAPLHRSRAMPWLRSLLQEHWRLHSDLPPPSEHALYGVHSGKATVLSWARQLHLDPELRRLQGHHRPSAMEGSVRVYSRDDIAAPGRHH